MQERDYVLEIIKQCENKKGNDRFISVFKLLDAYGIEKATLGMRKAFRMVSEFTDYKYKNPKGG